MQARNQLAAQMGNTPRKKAKGGERREKVAKPRRLRQQARSEPDWRCVRDLIRRNQNKSPTATGNWILNVQ